MICLQNFPFMVFTGSAWLYKDPWEGVVWALRFHRSIQMVLRDYMGNRLEFYNVLTTKESL